MGSLQEIHRLLRQKEDRIKELERQLIEKDERIQELTSQLDKYQSILPQSPTVLGRPRKQRAQGISAEPASQRSLQDFATKSFKKYSKSIK